MTVPVIPRGGHAAEERREAEKNARKNRTFSSDWEYLNLAGPEGDGLEGETKYFRLVTDEPDFRETRQHSFVNTKSAPADKPEGKKWPAKMGSVCRHAPGFDAIYDDCFICDSGLYDKEDSKGKMRKPYAGLRLWAVAVEREPVIGTKEMADRGEIEPYEVGSPAGFRDVEIEKDEYVDGEATGKKIKIKKFLVLNFGLENFFNALLGFHTSYGTLLDRDYKVTRKGTGTDTTYSISPMDKIRVDGKPFDLRNPDFAKQYEIPFNLDEIIANLASDEYYQWFFDTTVESSWEARFPNRESEEGASKEENQKAQDNATAETISKMRDKFKVSK